MLVFIMGTIMLVVFFDTVYKKLWISPEIFRVEGRTVIIVSFLWQRFLPSSKILVFRSLVQGFQPE